MKKVPAEAWSKREYCKTVLYLLIIIILISYIVIKLLIKRRIIPAKTGNRTRVMSVENIYEIELILALPN